MLNIRLMLYISIVMLSLQETLISMTEDKPISVMPSLISPLTWQITPKTIEIINTIEKNVLTALVEIYSSDAIHTSDVYELLNITEYPESSKLIDYIVKDEIAQQKTALKASITPSLERNVKHLIALLERILLNEILLQLEHTTPLKWCPCTSSGQRIYFIFQMLRQVTRKSPNPQERLVYTSVSIDGLLQDYLFIAELMHAGYKNITINIIQLRIDYDRWPYKNATGTDQMHLKYHQKIGNYAQTIDTFKKKLAHLAKSLPDVTLTARIFASAYSYLNLVKNNPQEKSSVLLMIDPGHGVIAKPRHFGHANVLKIALDDHNSALIFMPSTQQPQLYIQQEKNPPADVIKKIEALIHILKYFTNVSSDNYRFSLFKKLVTDNIIAPHNATQLWQESLPSRKQTEAFPFYLDPYLTFQDLVRAGVKNGAIIYLFANTSTHDLQSMLLRIVPKLYVQEDVVTSHNGLFYIQEHGFKKITLPSPSS